MPKTTKYEPKPTALPAGQPTGFAAEAVRRARGQNPFVQALLNARFPTKQRAPSTGSKVRVNVEIGDRDKKGRDFQREQQESRQEFAKSQAVDQRAWVEEQNQLEALNKIALADATSRMNDMFGVLEAKEKNFRTEEAKTRESLDSILAGDPAALAVLEAEGVSIEEAIKQMQDASKKRRQLFREEDFSDRGKARETMLQRMRTQITGEAGPPTTRPPEATTLETEPSITAPPEQTLPVTIGLGAGLPEEKLPDRAYDYAYVDFLEEVQAGLLTADARGIFDRKEIAEIKLKTAVALNEMKDLGVRKFNSLLNSNGMDEVGVVLKAEQLVPKLIELVGTALDEDQPVNQDAVNKAFADLNEEPGPREAVRRTLSGERDPYDTKEAAAAHVGAVYYGNIQILDKFLKMTDPKGNEDFKSQIADRFNTWWPEGTDKPRRHKAVHQLREIAQGLKYKLSSMIANPMAERFVDYKIRPQDGFFKNYLTVDPLLLEALKEKGVGATAGMAEAAKSRLRGTGQDFVAELAKLEAGRSPFSAFMRQENHLSPSARQLLHQEDAGLLRQPEKSWTVGPAQQAPGGPQPSAAPTPESPKGFGIEMSPWLEKYLERKGSSGPPEIIPGP